MEAYLYDCLRTPRTKARAGGSLAATPPAQLVTQLVQAIQAGAPASAEPSALMLGCVGQINAQGGNIALSSKLHAGLPDSCTAMTLNHFCASGLSSIGMAANACALGQHRAVFAGGVECMSQVPFMADRANYYSDTTLAPDVRYLPVALSADLLATREGVGRRELDEFTLQSHRRAAQAARYQRSRIGILDEAGGLIAEEDECVRADTDMDKLSAMASGFEALAAQYEETLRGRPLSFLHSVANAPPMVDGAALALVGAGEAKKHARARILDWADGAADPTESLTGGMAAMEQLLQRQKLSLSDIDRIEFMEAFAVVPALFHRRFTVDADKVNVAGGHLAKGHPMGATGAILLSTLLDVLTEDDKTLGLVVATGAGGLGSAMLIERLK